MSEHCGPCTLFEEIFFSVALQKGCLDLGLFSEYGDLRKVLNLKCANHRTQCFVKPF
jgi:hypothetical protein